MKAHLLLFLVSILGLNIFAQQQPMVIKPTIWLKADFNGDSLNRWDDISGNGFHAFTQNGVIKPDTVLFNYNNAFYLSNQDNPFYIYYISSHIFFTGIQDIFVSEVQKAVF